MMVGLFGLSHVAYCLKGVRFDATPLAWYWQYLDPLLLRHRLAESLLYLHSQPPLFNLLLGAALKLFSGHLTLALHAFYLFLGMVLYGTVFAIMRRLGISRATALVLSTWFMVSPSFVLYEHWLFYTLPVATLLTLSALLFYEVLDKQRTWQALYFFGLLFMLCAMRTTFHLLYYVSVLGALLILCRPRRKMIVGTALVPLLLLASLYVKNLVLFGEFSASSWTGMNLAATTVGQLPSHEREPLIKQGKLSPVAMIPRFSRLESYPRGYLEENGFRGIAALRQVRKSTGAPNYNHLAYVSISKRYLKDDLYVMAHRPKALLAGLLYSWYYYYQSTGGYFGLDMNRNKTAPLDVLYDHLFYGAIPWRVWLPILAKLSPGYPAAPSLIPRPFVFLLVGLPLVLFWGMRLAVKPQQAAATLSRPQRMLILYVCLNIIYVALVGNFFECGENERFRFEIDPLHVVLLGLLLHYSALPWLGSVFSSSRRTRLKELAPEWASSTDCGASRGDGSRCVCWGPMVPRLQVFSWAPGLALPVPSGDCIPLP